jgi:hypothetical protein
VPVHEVRFSVALSRVSYSSDHQYPRILYTHTHTEGLGWISAPFVCRPAIYNLVAPPRGGGRDTDLQKLAAVHRHNSVREAERRWAAGCKADHP